MSPSTHSRSSPSPSSLLCHSPLTHPLPLTYTPSFSPSQHSDVLDLFYMDGCFACIYVSVYHSCMCLVTDFRGQEEVSHSLQLKLKLILSLLVGVGNHQLTSPGWGDSSLEQPGWGFLRKKLIFSLDFWGCLCCPGTLANYGGNKVKRMWAPYCHL